MGVSSHWYHVWLRIHLTCSRRKTAQQVDHGRERGHQQGRPVAAEPDTAELIGLASLFSFGVEHEVTRHRLDRLPRLPRREDQVLSYAFARAPRSSPSGAWPVYSGAARERFIMAGNRSAGPEGDLAPILAVACSRPDADSRGLDLENERVPLLYFRQWDKVVRFRGEIAVEGLSVEQKRVDPSSVVELQEQALALGSIGGRPNRRDRRRRRGLPGSQRTGRVIRSPAAPQTDGALALPTAAKADSMLVHAATLRAKRPCIRLDRRGKGARFCDANFKIRAGSGIVCESTTHYSQFAHE